MMLEEHQLSSNSRLGGGVRRIVLQDSNIKITQITTFCPDLIGPGPTQLYLIESDALILLDTGLPTDLAKDLFYRWRNEPIPRAIDELPRNYSEQQFLNGLKAAGYSCKDIDLIVISHGHPDHFLLANSILSQCNASVSAHIQDTPAMCNPWGLLNMWFSRQQQMAATGMPKPWSGQPAVREQLIRTFEVDLLNLALTIKSPFIASGPVKVNGAPVKSVEVKHLPGHSAGSIGLIVGDRLGKALMSGDVLLNPITPHPDDLLAYLRTLEELSRHNDIVLVLPGHGELIRDLPARISLLQEHHRRRLELTYENLNTAKCVWDIAIMDGYFDVYLNPLKFNPLAGTEVLVHIEILKMVEAVCRVDIKNSVHYFQNSSEPFEEVYGRILELVRMTPTGAIMRF